jgi:hypothetical protein
VEQTALRAGLHSTNKYVQLCTDFIRIRVTPCCAQITLSANELPVQFV